MLKFINKLLREHELGQLLSEIVRQHPELKKIEGERKIDHYLTLAVGEFTQSIKEYDEGRLPNEPQMPVLLLRTLRYWASHSATTYAFMIIQNHLELARLQQLVDAYEKMTDLFKGREVEVLNLAEHVYKVVDDLNKASQPNNRMN